MADPTRQMDLRVFAQTAHLTTLQEAVLRHAVAQEGTRAPTHATFAEWQRRLQAILESVVTE